MNRLNAAALGLLLAAGCGSSGNDGPPVDATFIWGATLIPGDGSEPIEAATIIIENDIVKQVGKEGELFAPKGSLQLDYTGRTIIPMLVNLSAYPGLSSGEDFGASNYNRESLTADLRRFGYYGVAAVLAGGDSDGLAFQVRDEQRAGTLPGAQLYTSGRGIAARGSSGRIGDLPILVSNEADARAAVGELADRKVDAIVLWAGGMRADTAAAVIDEAHMHNLKVFADAPALNEAKAVVKAGVDGLIASVRDREVDDEFVSLMKERNTPLAPGLTSLEARFVYLDKPRWLGEQAMREVYPPGLSAYLTNQVVLSRIQRDPQLNTYRRQFETASANLKRLSDDGVRIAFGSGSGLPGTFPGYFEHRELELMVAAGMSPMNVITAATSVSAEALGLNDMGAVVSGKKANFMVLADDVLERMYDSRSIDKVFRDGKEVNRAELIRTIEPVVPKITQEDIREEQNIQQRIAEQAAEDKMDHYGDFVLGDTVRITSEGLSIPTPRRSKSQLTLGPPHRLVVSMSASGAQLREFYADVLRELRWSAAGSCWERTHPLQGDKRVRLCAEPASNQIVLNISVQ